MKAFVKASVEDIEDMKASTKVSSTQAFMAAWVSFRGLASVEAFLEDMGDMKVSVEAKSTGACTKTSMEVMEAFAKVMKASLEVEVTSMEA